MGPELKVLINTSLPQVYFHNWFLGLINRRSITLSLIEISNKQSPADKLSGIGRKRKSRDGIFKNGIPEEIIRTKRNALMASVNHIIVYDNICKECGKTGLQDTFKDIQIQAKPEMTSIVRLLSKWLACGCLPKLQITDRRTFIWVLLQRKRHIVSSPVVLTACKANALILHLLHWWQKAWCAGAAQRSFAKSFWKKVTKRQGYFPESLV